MNIFVLSECPIQSAILQCDKHVVKMIVESAQMLSTIHRMLDGKEERRLSKSGKTNVKYWSLSDYRELIMYKAVHMYHPCTVWTGESLANYQWHYEHFVALCDEYQYRYGKTHKTDTLLRKVLSKAPSNIPNKALTPFKLAMGSNPECMLADPVESYRAFYQTKQERFKMVWTGRDIPEWFNVKESFTL